MFTRVIDHRPSLGLMGENKPIGHFLIIVNKFNSLNITQLTSELKGKVPAMHGGASL